jgi:ribosomal protein S18 acetylase RimI-like enzyme
MVELQLSDDYYQLLLFTAKKVYMITMKSTTEEIEFISLRKATAADFPAIREDAQLARQASYSYFMTPEDIQSDIQHYYNDEVLNSILANPANAIYVAQRGQKIVGHLCVLPKDRHGHSRILQFFVRPECQRKGVGELLFEHACTHLREAGSTQFLVGTVIQNNYGRSFFKKKGLEQIEEYDSVWDGKTSTVALYRGLLY